MNKTCPGTMISSMPRQGISITHDQCPLEPEYPIDSYQDPISGTLHCCKMAAMIGSRETWESILMAVLIVSPNLSLQHLIIYQLERKALFLPVQ